MIQPGLAACAIAAIVAVYLLSVLMTIRMVNAKGRKWGGLRILVYLYPVLGLLVAMLLPVRRQAETSEQTVSESASNVKLLWRTAPETHRRLGQVEVEIRRPSEHAQPCLEEIAGRLRSAAAQMGANAVAEVDFVRARPRLWSIKPQHVLQARGVAVQLTPEMHTSAISDAEQAGQVIDADPREALKERLMAAGVASIFWGIFNAAAMHDVAQHLDAGLPLYVAWFVIYVLSPWMLVEGLVLLRVQRPALLIPDGFTVIAVGIVNVLVGIPPLGIFQIVWGAISLFAFLDFTWQIRKYGRAIASLNRLRSAGATLTNAELANA